MKHTLTVKKLDALKPTEKRYRVTDGDGLFVEVMPAGKKYFRARIIESGRRIDVTYGVYPELSLADARKKHEARRAAAPHAPKQETLTFADVYAKWIAVYAITPSQKTKRVPNDYTVWRINRRNRLFLAEINARPIADIRRGELVSALDAINGKEEARQTFNQLRVMFEWAGIREYISASPLVGVRAQSLGLSARKSKQRFRTLDQLVDLWLTCADDMCGRAIRVLILTGARRSMVAGMTWAEVGGWWEIPGSRMKNGEPQSILNTFADIIEPLRLLQGSGTRGFVFESGSKAGHLLPGSLTTHIARLAEAKGWNFSVHDLRRSVRTAWAEELKTAPHIAELMLAHKQEKLEGIYNKAKLLDEQAAVWTAWRTLLLERINSRTAPSQQA